MVNVPELIPSMTFDFQIRCLVLRCLVVVTETDNAGMLYSDISAFVQRKDDKSVENDTSRCAGTWTVRIGKGQIQLRYPARELVRELVCHLLATC